MPAPVDVPRPAALWRSLPDERKQAIARAFWEDDQSLSEQAEAIGLIARQINFRPKSVITLPVERKAAHLARMSRLSDTLAHRLLVAYHLVHKRPMMGSFLDALGVKHENGLIADDHVARPEPEQLAEAARTLAAAYPQEDVRLYFATLLSQDAETWGGLAETLAG
jgi:hypothetical protein